MIVLRYIRQSTDVSKQFDELSCYDLPDVERTEGTTLRGNKISHRLRDRRVWNIVISPTTPDNDVAWIKEWWCAEQQFLAVEPNIGTWIPVVTASGRCPIELIEGCIDYPEATLEIFEKAGS